MIGICFGKRNGSAEYADKNKKVEKDFDVEGGNRKKGVLPKLLGMMLVLLSSLNLMLCWRGGLSTGVFYPILLAFGIMLFAYGALREVQYK